MGRARRRLGRRAGAPALLSAGRARRDRDGQPAGLSRSAVRDLACRARRGADQRQAPSRRVSLHSRPFRRAAMLCRRRARRNRGTARRRPAGSRANRRGGRCRVAPIPRRRRSGAGRAAARGSRLALLYQRHHRAAEGRDADQPKSHGDVPRLLLRRRSDRAGRCHLACGAVVARLRALWLAACGEGRQQRDRGEQPLRSRGDIGVAAALARHQPLRRAHHADASHRA